MEWLTRMLTLAPYTHQGLLPQRSESRKLILCAYYPIISRSFARTALFVEKLFSIT